jgi:hypothetical protein
MNSLFQESPEQLAIRSPIKLSNQEYVQIFIKAMISPDVILNPYSRLSPAKPSSNRIISRATMRTTN